MRALLLFSAMVMLGAASAWAGDRPPEAVLVNMTPDALSSEASKTCVRAIEARLKQDGAKVARLGETALRKLAKKTAGEPFLAWPPGAFEPAKRGGVDAAILVDCRPELGAIDVVVAPAEGTARIELRRVRVDEAATEWVSTAILRRARIGFSP